MAATVDGKIYSWGKASRGQLGRPSSSSRPVSEPQELVPHDPPKDKSVVSLCASHGNTLLVLSGEYIGFLRRRKLMRCNATCTRPLS